MDAVRVAAGLIVCTCGEILARIPAAGGRAPPPEGALHRLWLVTYRSPHRFRQVRWLPARCTRPVSAGYDIVVRAPTFTAGARSAGVMKGARRWPRSVPNRFALPS
jgi:hypothetical protein